MRDRKGEREDAGAAAEGANAARAAFGTGPSNCVLLLELLPGGRGGPRRAARPSRLLW